MDCAGAINFELCWLGRVPNTPHLSRLDNFSGVAQSRLHLFDFS
jgi:hypothetical protein